jgi:hypothetical protein
VRVPLYGRQYDPESWEQPRFPLTCVKCGTSYEITATELATPPPRGQTIKVNIPYACPGCGESGTATVELKNAGQPGQG